MEQTQMYCKGCQQSTLAQRPKVNHILHLLLSVLTAGVWIIVWILVSFLHLGGWKCSHCGGDTHYFDKGPNGEGSNHTSDVVGFIIAAVVVFGLYLAYG